MSDVFSHEVVVVSVGICTVADGMSLFAASFAGGCTELGADGTAVCVGGLADIMGGIGGWGHSDVETEGAEGFVCCASFLLCYLALIGGGDEGTDRGHIGVGLGCCFGELVALVGSQGTIGLLVVMSTFMEVSKMNQFWCLDW